MKKNRIVAFALVLALIIGVIPVYAASAQTFTDVPPSHWAYADIQAAAADGVINGVGNNRFNPEGYLTIAEWSCIMARAFYPEGVEQRTKTNWYNREMDTLTSSAVFAGLFDEITDVNAYATRALMATMIGNMLPSHGVRWVTTVDLEAYKAGIADLDGFPKFKQDAIAACYALGILNGVGDNRFDGNGYVQRGAAAAVYNRTKKAIQNGGQIAVAPTPITSPPVPGESHVVGTISSVRLDFREEARTGEIFKSHAPITDYWSQQSEEIRSISDKDSFNAACQTLKDSEMILTQGELERGFNPYYNYAVVPDVSNQAQKNVDGAMGALNGYGGGYGPRSVSGYLSTVLYVLVPLSADKTSAPRFAATIAQINANPGMTDKEKAALCVNAVCDQIDYQFAGGASWGNGKGTGDCESYARMLNDLLSAAGIPNMNIAGPTNEGPHAWVQAKLDGQWYALDGTVAEVGYDNGGIMSFAEFESIWGSFGVNDRDAYKVARALIDAAYPAEN